MMTPDERYRLDPMFQALVDALEAQIHAAQYTPSELREAVILAATRYEMRQLPQPFFYVDQDEDFRVADERQRPLRPGRRACARCSERGGRPHGFPVIHEPGERCPLEPRGDPASERAGNGRHTP